MGKESSNQTATIGNIFEMNGNSILSGIAKIGLKSLVECVRLCTFNQYGYQQMQLDVAFIRLVWNNLEFDREGAIDRMCDDVLESTSWRCFQLIPMGTKIIESICNEKLNKETSLLKQKESTQ